MPRLSHQPPKLRKHKASGQSVVTINGRDIYCGPWGSAASREKYARTVSEWFARKGAAPRSPSAVPVTVARLIANYFRHVHVYYRRKDGSATSEPRNIRDALRPVLEMYAATPVTEFGPLALKAVRENMIGRGWCRTNINKAVDRIRRMFRWGVENELVPSSVLDGLRAVSGLRAGRTEARESDPVRPVPHHIVDATLLFLSPVVADMVRLQLLTGMRPGEVCQMRGCDIEMKGDIWIYRPSQHKTMHCGHERMVYLGDRAQEIVQSSLRRNPQEYLFSPADAEVIRRERAHRNRQTALNEGNRPGTHRTRRPRKRAGAFYVPISYAHAIRNACRKAFDMPEELRDPRKGTVAYGKETCERREDRQRRRRQWDSLHCWHPHQLRHTFGTEVRQQHGVEAAQVLLGHRTLRATEVYAEANQDKARSIASRIG